MQLPDFTAGTVLTAAALDAAFAQLFPVGAAQATYTPTLTQSATVAKNVEYSEYIQIGAWCFANVSLAVTGAGVAANQIIAGLPPLTPASYRHLGHGSVYDASAATWYSGMVNWLSATTCRIMAPASTAGLGQGVMTAALAAGDLVMLNLAYRTTAN